MKAEPEHIAELYELAGAQCDGVLMAEQTARLEELVLGDVRLRRAYVLYMQVHACAEKCGVEETESDVQNRDPTLDASLPSLSTTHYPLPNAFVGGPVFSYLVATVVLCLMLLGAWAYKITHNSNNIAAKGRGTATTGLSEQEELVFVGIITGMKGCRWSISDTQTVAGASVPLDREYALSSGLLEITYKTGARVILEGPCTYKVESSTSGYLAVGKLTARVETKGSGVRDQGSEHSPLFAVRTPTAIVTDLGTEFGVEVAANGDTSSYVFQGSIKVQGLSASADSGAAHNGKVLHVNESIQVSRVRETRQDSTATETVRFTHPTITPKFVRWINEPPQLLDLLDIVAGGNGTGRRRERGIDPQSGKQDTYFLLDRRTTERPYSSVQWNPFVDGVFIPKLDFQPVPIQLDSAGHVFDGFTPRNDKSGPPGRTAGSIWARATIVSPLNRSKERWHWIYTTNIEKRFMPEGRGLLCMQSNSGITFDLAAVRRVYKNAIPARFKATAGMVDAEPLFADKDTRGMADLWVFVDGRLKRKRSQLRPQDGTLAFDVELGPTDRFLTLVITDSANGANFDWIVWGDPILEMTTTDTEHEAKHPEQPVVKGGATIHHTNGTSEK